MSSTTRTPPLSLLRAYGYGLRDGWRQPHELISSRNIEHLPGYSWWLQNEQDRAINWGQRIRSPFRHQHIEPQLQDVHTYIVTVSGCTADQAATVIAERLGPDEGYGFGYTIGYRDA